MYDSGWIEPTQDLTYGRYFQIVHNLNSPLGRYIVFFIGANEDFSTLEIFQNCRIVEHDNNQFRLLPLSGTMLSHGRVIMLRGWNKNFYAYDSAQPELGE
jgi:hypothetical protein